MNTISIRKRSVAKKQTNQPMAGYKGILQNEYILFQIPFIKLTVLKSNSFGWMCIEENQTNPFNSCGSCFWTYTRDHGFGNDSAF